MMTISRCPIAAVLAAVVCVGCQKETATSRPSTRVKEPPDHTVLAEAPYESSLPAAVHAGKVELRDGDGQELFSFKPQDGNGTQFCDREGVALCTLAYADGILKVKRADDQPLCELKKKGDKVMVKDATGENELFKFKLKGEDIDAYAPGDRRLYRIRKKDYGYALEDNQDQTLFRAKAKDGKTVLRDPHDVTVLSCADVSTPLGLVFFRMKELSPQQQAACFVFFLER